MSAEYVVFFTGDGDETETECEAPSFLAGVDDCENYANWSLEAKNPSENADVSLCTEHKDLAKSQGLA